MLRQLASRCSLWRGSGLTLVRAASSAPSVADKIITLTLVDKLGRRHVLRGLEGQTVVDVVQQHSDMFEDEVVCLSPEGRDKWEMHVKVPNELAGRLPPPVGDDANVLNSVAQPGTIDKHSRLGSRIVLSKELDGILVALSDIAPWKTL